MEAEQPSNGKVPARKLIGNVELRNIYVAAYLMFEGHTVTLHPIGKPSKRGRKQKHVFRFDVFEGEEDLLPTKAADYHSGKSEGKLKDFASQIEHLRDLIHLSRTRRTLTRSMGKDAITQTIRQARPAKASEANSHRASS